MLLKALCLYSDQNLYILSSPFKLNNSYKIGNCENSGFLNSKESVALMCIFIGTTAVTMVADYTAVGCGLLILTKHDFNIYSL